MGSFASSLGWFGTGAGKHHEFFCPFVDRCGLLWKLCPMLYLVHELNNCMCLGDHCGVIQQGRATIFPISSAMTLIPTLPSSPPSHLQTT